MRNPAYPLTPFDAKLAHSLTVGVRWAASSLIMAWVIIVMAIKGWAVHRRA